MDLEVEPTVMSPFLDTKVTQQYSSTSNFG